MKSLFAITALSLLFISCNSNHGKYDEKKICGCATMMLNLSRKLKNVQNNDSLERISIIRKYKNEIKICDEFDDKLSAEEKKEVENILLNCPSTKKLNKELNH
jgi:hypothetical protein